MLKLTVYTQEGWDEQKQEFVPPKELATLQLEHSLVSLSKWESKWRKPFIHTPNLTYEETLDYIKCMTLTQNVKPEVYDHLTEENVEEIRRYIDAPMTATTFSQSSGGSTKQRRVTSELVYYWMIALNIPFECQKWHLNRLITLIRVCEAENQPAKKMNKGDIARRNAELNRQRRERLKSKG